MTDLIQGTEEWKLARCGSLGASRMADAVARIAKGYGASRANLMAELLVERLTGVPNEGFVSPAMAWGTEKEPEARAAYEFRADVDVQQVGIVPHPTIAGTHASPDGLVGEDGLIEIKCPNTASHVETLLGDDIAGKYITQMQWQMACTGRKWCDFVSFDPRLPETMALFVKRVNRDDRRIAELETEARAFLTELDAKVSSLRDRYETKAAA
jgi:putative phage-type endonuclease